jgi:hypothetical protein
VKFFEIVNEDWESDAAEREKRERGHDAFDASHDQAFKRRRPPDRTPEVGDHRMWGGMSGSLIKQAKRLEHIVDELEGFNVEEADPTVLQRFRDALIDLNDIDMGDDDESE